MKPLIAITARTDNDVNSKQWTVNKNYSECIVRAGGIPVLLLGDNITDLEIILARVDGLLVTGGIDVDPMSYNEEKRTVCQDTNIELDKFDIEVIKKAKSKGLPIFGICRGLQIINVAFGGTLHQDIYDELQIKPGYHNSRDEGSSSLLVDGKHEINIVKDSSLFKLLGETTLVNTFHHQSIKTCSTELRVVARAMDGVIEAIEDEGILAVQWHPERMDDQQILFDNFVTTCIKEKSSLHK